MHKRSNEFKGEIMCSKEACYNCVSEMKGECCTLRHCPIKWDLRYENLEEDIRAVKLKCGVCGIEYTSKSSIVSRGEEEGYFWNCGSEYCLENYRAYNHCNNCGVTLSKKEGYNYLTDKICYNCEIIE